MQKVDQLQYSFFPVTDLVLFRQVHFSKSDICSLWDKDRIIAKSLISDWGVENPTIEATFLNMRSAIWKSQRCYACEMRTTLFIGNSN